MYSIKIHFVQRYPLEESKFFKSTVYIIEY